jgi:hypothetical protein
MDEKDPKNEAMPVVVILERRTQRRGELSSEDIMKILRKRAAARVARRESNGGSNAAG